MPSMITGVPRCTTVMSVQASIAGVIAVVGLRVVGAQELQRPVGEHHAEAEGGIARILLDDADLPARQLALHEVGEVQARPARRPR